MKNSLKKGISNYFILSILLSNALLISIVYLMDFFEKKDFFALIIASIYLLVLLFTLYYKKKAPVLNNLFLISLSILFLPFVSGRLFLSINIIFFIYLNTRMLSYNYKKLRRLFVFSKYKWAKFILFELVLLLIMDSILVYIAYR